MAGRRQDLETRIIAKDDASKVIDRVAGELDDLEKKDTTIDLKAEDHASADIKSLSQKLAGLSDDEKTIVLDAAVGNAQRKIDGILKSLSRVDSMKDEEVTVRIEALDHAKADLDRIQAEIRDLDGETATVKVESTGLDELTGALDNLPGQLGSITSTLGSGGTLVGGAAALAASLGAAALSAADMAIDAKTTSDLTGDSVEDASRLQAVWKLSGADLNDLNDVLLQMNGVLQENPELAGQIGVNLQDGATIGQRFVEVVKRLDNFTGTASEKALIMAQVFGEEGVRQVAKLTALVGDDLADAMTDIAETQVMSQEDVDRAIELKAQVAEVTAQFQQMAVELGQTIIPLMSDMADLANSIKLPTFAEWSTQPLERFNGQLDRAKISWHALVTEDVHGTVAANLGEIAEVSGTVADNSARVNSETRQYLAYARTRKTLENEAATAATEAQEQQIENLKEMVEGLVAYNDAVKSTEWESAELEGAITAIDEFADAHFGLAEIAQASADAEQALADAVKENGAAFDFGTEAGLKNLDAIEGVAEAVGVKLAAAYDDADGKQRKFRESAAEIADSTLARLREEMGLSEEETAELAEALGLMPEDIETRYELSGIEEAKVKLDLLSTSIDDLPENVETKVTQKIIAGDYEGALRVIQRFYDDNPAILPVKPVIGSYVYPPGLIPTGSSTGGAGTLSAGPMAAGVTPMAGPTLPTLMLPVAAPARGGQPVVNLYTTIQAAVVGDSFDVARAVEEATRRTLRLMPARP